eukprot:gene20457-22473_t
MANMVNLHVTSSISSFGSERRFPLDTTLHSLKGKLELITGAMSQSMSLELFDKDNKLLCKLDNDDGTLRDYNVEDGMTLHVIDNNPGRTAGEFEDVSQVEKYELKNEEYDKKQDTVRNFLRKNKMGKFSDEAQNADERARQKELHEEELAKSMKIGNRCEICVPKQPKRRGTVMYIGLPDFKPGYWVGIKYDEPLGKNDGTVKGVRYFECAPKYGGFVRPSQVTIGDFPEEDLGLDDDEM